MYIQELKLALECDENEHSNCNNEEELERQNFISNELGCKFLRYSPYDKNFSIFKLINIILTHAKNHLAC